MKKILSIVGVFVLALNLFSFNVFAGTNEDLLSKLLSQKKLSGHVTADFYVVLNESLPEFLDASGEITEILSNSKLSVDAKYVANDDGTKLQAEVVMSFVLPDSLSSQLDFNSLKYWIDMDFSDASNLVYEIALKSPYSDEYISFNYAELIQPEMIALIKQLSQQNNSNIILEVIENITPYINFNLQERKFTLTLDEATLKENLLPLFTKLMDYSSTFSSVDGEKRAYYNSEFNDLLSKLLDCKLFDENEAIVFDISFNEAEQIESEKITINVDTNVFDLMKTFNSSSSSLYSLFGLEAFVNLSIIVDVNYSHTNEVVNIEFPSDVSKVL